MDNLWIYVGTGFVGLLWGSGYVQPAVALAFLAGIWLGSGGDVVKWVVIALILGYIVGSMILAKKGQAVR